MSQKPTETRSSSTQPGSRNPTEHHGIQRREPSTSTSRMNQWDRDKLERDKVTELQNQLHHEGTSRRNLLRDKHLAEERLIRELTAARDELRNKSALLATRTAELHDAQKFLTRVDNYADAEIVRMFSGLNSHIFQTAAQVADAVEFSDERGRGYYKLANQLIGKEMVEILSEKPHRDDPICVQIAGRNVMVMFASRVLNVWDFTPGSNHVLLDQVYMQMKRSEPSMVSSLEKHLKDDVVRVLEVAEVFRRKIPISYRHMPGAAKYYWGRRRLGDLEAETVSHGALYDSKNMVDDLADKDRTVANARHTPRMLCTVEMGVRRVEQVERGQKKEEEVIVLLKPKVVLESMVQEL
ncbi:uncharacterized protein FIBRA_06834 [Fibroporia radiculosa]|uniref:Uncharacterized protein n=1 Tax=Fibroporia radiculosa TaxID=599839 RepID=J4GTN2_9APHY|nr:uncharacterized protein FIBRA_06834 [Fibroporia radiculosa]CCM04650.1 predicted protein [Fibroporia radiculosa]